MQFIWTITVADKALKCPRFTAKVQPLHMWCNVFCLHIERRGNVSVVANKGPKTNPVTSASDSIFHQLQLLINFVKE